MHPKNPTQAPILNSSCPGRSNPTLTTLQTAPVAVPTKNAKQLPRALPSILRTPIESSSKLTIFVQASADEEALVKVTAIASAIIIGPKAGDATSNLRPAPDLTQGDVSTNQLSRLFETGWSAGSVTHRVHHRIFAPHNPALLSSARLDVAGPIARKEQGDEYAPTAASLRPKTLSKDLKWT